MKLLLFLSTVLAFASAYAAQKEVKKAPHLCEGCEIVITSCDKLTDGLASIEVLDGSKRVLRVYDHFEKKPCEFTNSEVYGNEPWSGSVKSYPGKNFEIFVVSGNGDFLIAVGTHNGKMVAKTYGMAAREYFEVSPDSYNFEFVSLDPSTTKVVLNKTMRSTNQKEKVSYSIDKLLDGSAQIQDH